MFAAIRASVSKVTFLSLTAGPYDIGFPLELGSCTVTIHALDLRYAGISSLAPTLFNFFPVSGSTNGARIFSDWLRVRALSILSLDTGAKNSSMGPIGLFLATIFL